MIQVRTSGGQPNFQVIEREFNTVQKAHDYLKEVFKGRKVKGNDDQHRVFTFADGYQVSINYDYRRIKDLKDPPKELPQIFVRQTAVMPKRAESATTKAAASKPVASGEMIPLKAVCRDLNIEPRVARMKLRSAMKSGKLKDDGRGRWEWSAKEVEEVKKILSK